MDQNQGSQEETHHPTHRLDDMLDDNLQIV